MRLSFLFFAASIFLGSFLLFQVQPIISKYLLPTFGGTSSVWMVAMLFFQTLLLFGYLYTFCLSRLSLKKQTLIHALLILGVLLTGISLFPKESMQNATFSSPVQILLLILFFSVGMPYFLLATTSVLLQKWFGRIQSKNSPYPLYALSNIASLLALVSYPFLVEPFLSLKKQGEIWIAGFSLYAVILLGSCLVTFVSSQKKIKLKPIHTSLSKKSMFLWIGLSATSTLMLLAMTNMQTQAIAPVPFLWLLPLSIYLLSFILCFSGGQWYFRNFFAYLFLLTAPIALIFTFSNPPSLFFGIILYSAVLLSCCMICHGELYRLRPAVDRLDTFYVCIALGSVISGIFVGIIAPVIFQGFWEIYLGFYLSFFVTALILSENRHSFLFTKLRLFFASKKEFYLAFGIGFPVVLVVLSGVLTVLSNYSSTKTMRSFYGVIAVNQRQTAELTVTQLMHGNIIHGSQFTNDRFTPTTYYGRQSGVGQAIKELQKKKKSLRVAIIGLGAGTIAAYGRENDRLVFYEINPQVIQIAKDDFTYLADSKAKSEIVLGDGRLSLAKEQRKFDLIILDAFSDDAIPIHLLTKEAFAMYLDKLSDDGILAVHISNNYIDLKPLLIQIAKHFVLSQNVIRSKGNETTSEAEWVLLQRGQGVFDKDKKTVQLWTDDYSNLFQLVK